ncbi:hypothetical protein [Nonomuraea maheshkhaliensis]
MVLTDTGAKLSKSLIRDGRTPPPPGTHDWMLDIATWPGDVVSFNIERARFSRSRCLQSHDMGKD